VTKDLDPDTFYRWSRRWMEAEREMSTKEADQLAALKAHLARMEDMEKLVGGMVKAGVARTPADESMGTYYRLEAEDLLARANGHGATPPTRP
jgi:hypothetical protein